MLCLYFASRANNAATGYVVLLVHVLLGEVIILLLVMSLWSVYVSLEELIILLMALSLCDLCFAS